MTTAIKEPWQMTREEFVTEGIAKDEAIKRNIGQTLNIPMARQHWTAQHETLVKDAVREGKLVPPEVLKDYPDLKPVTLEVTIPEGMTKAEFVKQNADLVVKEKGRWGTIHYALKTRIGDYQKVGQITSDSPEGVLEQLYDKLVAIPKAPITPEPKAEKGKAPEEIYASKYRKWAEGKYKGLPPKEPIGVSKDFLFDTRIEIRRAIKKGKPIPTLAELQRIHAKRSPLSRASDERQSHQVTIEPDSPKVKAWITDPSRADISGIDTPRLTKRSPRITPKRPRLKR